MRIAVRPSAVLIARQPSRSQPRSVSINRRTSCVGERSVSKRRRLERNSSCSLEKLNFTALSQFPDVLLVGRRHTNRRRSKGRWPPPALAYAPTPQSSEPRLCQVWLHRGEGRKRRILLTRGGRRGAAGVLIVVVGRLMLSPLVGADSAPVALGRRRR